MSSFYRFTRFIGGAAVWLMEIGGDAVQHEIVLKPNGFKNLFGFLLADR